MFKKSLILILLVWFGLLNTSLAETLNSKEKKSLLLAQSFNQENDSDQSSGLLEDDDSDQLEDSEKEDDEESDNLLEDDEESDDLIADEEENDETENDDDFTNRVNYSNGYFFFGGYSYSDTADLANGNSIDSKAILENMYQFTGKLQTSEYSYYFLRLSSSLKLAKNYETDQYTEGYKIKVREGYHYQQDGKQRYKIGAQILKHGKVDYKSPINILGMTDQDAIDVLNFKDSTTPTLALVYDWLGKNHTTSLLFAPLKMKTKGTEFTLLKEETEDNEADKDPDDTTVLRAHAGVRYQTNFGKLSTRFSLFRWFDKDNDISWKEQRSAGSLNEVDTDQNYQEKDTSITFLTGEFDWTLENYVWKTDIGYFFQKNFLSYNKISSETDAYTVKLKHLAIATSLERKFDKLFLMPTYTYYKIWNVKADDHIIMYENRKKPEDKKHDLYKNQVALITGYEFSETVNGFLSYSTTTPFNMNEFNFSLTWTPGNGKHQFALKAFMTQSEKIKMTDEQVKRQVAFISYNYKM